MMLRIAPIAVVMVMAVLAAACGDRSEGVGTPSASTTASVSVAATPSAAATAAPSARPAPNGERALFLRGPGFTGSYPIRGPLWVANIDGSEAVRISPDGAVATFGSVMTNKDGALLVYFVSHGEAEDEIVVYDANSRASSVLVSGAGITSVSASPTLSLLAFTQAGNLNLLDEASGDVQRLLDGGDREACDNYVISECRGFYGVEWSPDGRLMAVSEGLWEGALQHVVDPLAAEPKVALGGRSAFGGWVPSSDAICTAGRYGDTSALAINRAPNWETLVLLEEYEDWMSNPKGTSVQSCAWMGMNQVVILTSNLNDPNVSSVGVIDLARRELDEVASFDDSEYCCTRQIVLMPGGRRVITQAFDYRPESTSAATRPEVVDLRTGETEPILEPGDWVVGVLP